MEEGNGGKIAECRESSITPPVNNSEGCFFFFFLEREFCCSCLQDGIVLN